MPRPYFNKTTRELKTIFEDSAGDSDALELLLEELKHRKRPQARELRNKIEKLLSGKEPQQPLQRAPIAEVSSTTQEGEGGNTPVTSSTPAPARQINNAEAARQQSSSEQTPDNTLANIAFKKIEPMGAQGRPQKFVPKLDNDADIGIKATDSQTDKYRKALKFLVQEMKKSGSGFQQVSLDGGRRINAPGEGTTYVFSFSGEANLFEGAQVTVISGGHHSDGQIASISGGNMVITLDHDFGETIARCVLKYDATALLVALEKRLGELNDGDGGPAFNLELAKQVLSNSGAEQKPDKKTDIVDTEKLNAKQRGFVALALANKVSYLWGPPGTGKTQTLTALIRTLYEQDKRVLICSNTNQAVDQVLLQLCKALEKAKDPALENGAILRVGRITHPELEERFHDFVTIEGLVDRKSEELLEEKQIAEEGLHRIGLKMEPIDRLLKDFETLDGLEDGIKGNQNRLSKIKTQVERTKKEETNYGHKISKLHSEQNTIKSAGRLRRLFLRNPEVVQNEIDQQSRKRGNAASSIEQLMASVLPLDNKIQQLDRDISEYRAKLLNHDRTALKKDRTDLDDEMQPLLDEVSRINRALEDIRKEVMETSKIVGSTITKAYLSHKDFTSFDVVIVDEASMILPPALFHVAGLAQERCIISGDFRQLAPIVQTKAKAVKDLLGRDVFDIAGIAGAVNENKVPPRVVLLDEQYRMDKNICDLISTNFYGGLLKTSDDRPASKHKMSSDLIQDRLVIVDTSRVFPFSSRNAFKSRYNLMHALAVRNLCRHLSDNGYLLGQGSVGVCTPYNAQAKLLSQVIRGAGLEGKIDAGTVHRYQGDEKSLMIIDYPDGFGEKMAGIFLQSDSLEDDGAKLLNVAISRTQEHLIIFANLTVLDDKLPGGAFLRGVLHRIQSRGQVIDVRDVLGLYPIETDLSDLLRAESFDLDTNAFEKNLFDQKTFDRVVATDIAAAKKSVVIYSGFVTPNRVGALGELLRQKISEGVKVRCITRPPNNNGSMPEEMGREALVSLEGIGVAVDLRKNMHQKAVMIDDEVLWHGSLNPLSHTGGTGEVMMRIKDEGVTITYASFLAIEHWPASEDNIGKAAIKENDNCPDCGKWGVYAESYYGKYMYCEAGCGWKQNLGYNSQPRARADNTDGVEIKGDAPECPKCNISMRRKNGRYGSFWGCPNYPGCKQTINIRG